RLTPRGIPVANDAERVEPERLHLDWLPDPGRDDPVAHLGVHPGELHPGLARGEQAVRVQVDAIARALREPRDYRRAGSPQRLRCLRALPSARPPPRP